MFELLGLVVVKIFGHGWLWHRGETINSDEAFGNGGILLPIGFGAMIVIGLVTSTIMALF